MAWSSWFFKVCRVILICSKVWKPLKLTLYRCLKTSKGVSSSSAGSNPSPWIDTWDYFYKLRRRESCNSCSNIPEEWFTQVCGSTSQQRSPHHIWGIAELVSFNSLSLTISAYNWYPSTLILPFGIHSRSSPSPIWQPFDSWRAAASPSHSKDSLLWDHRSTVRLDITLSSCQLYVFHCENSYKGRIEKSPNGHDGLNIE